MVMQRIHPLFFCAHHHSMACAALMRMVSVIEMSHVVLEALEGIVLTEKIMMDEGKWLLE